MLKWRKNRRWTISSLLLGAPRNSDWDFLLQESVIGGNSWLANICEPISIDVEANYGEEAPLGAPTPQLVHRGHHAI